MDRPTKEQVAEFIKVMNDIMVFVAMRNLWNTPNDSIIKTMNWLDHEFGLWPPQQDQQAGSNE